jgi:ketosteroid isomerase-like protein
MPRFARLFEAAEDILDEYRLAMKRRDVEGVLRLWLDEDGISAVLPNGQRLDGHSALRDALGRLLAQKVVWIDPIHSVSHHTMGVSVFEATEALRFDECALEAELFVHTTYVLIQNHEGWRIAHLHSSPASGEVGLAPVSGISTQHALH